MFELDSVSFCLDEKVLLHPISLQFSTSKIYGIIGQNGSGKSTLIKLLARQHSASNGKLSFANKPIHQWKNKEFARQVAYLPQHLPQAHNLTVTALLKMGRYAWHGLLGSNPKQDQQVITEALARTNMTRYADQFVDTLSGGERSRVWLAMLLAQQSQFLLLDEPLAALDIAHQVEVMQLIKQLVQQLNLGVIIVIHDINLAARFCDHIVALQSGKLLMQGTPQQIMTPESLAKIYHIDLQVQSHPVDQTPIAFF
ncbi:iron-hydroxamate transporter ATP-binding subunit [Gallibacterium salpingitidis]|uniref:Iron-hydroxamate transporter ATP-binding subunit n=1 Tax=Gallibacterium salpingitidis TaxID=505341 RepID=A0A1A7Q290_9PAST|nr:ATP-binding cassette domain-containing protein [Gallibacterium salpingitidis]OBW92101.1 iron-hydroxamate transporter ATP-binding subunit [Gallibacterium salpingitidis]OBX08047.1 iron-hydroxamate transporter ATP-binding subunit [Gallibacterium salpingitidis]OBX11251.1 iron-hydroxamate transporter ATP-binding subunit [Gallibacterium salpingitidis]WKT00652.1 ATP-binding cassette domain-containing protein [Gallibacterium salpingitidis]